MNNIESYSPLVELCWLPEGLSWAIQVTGVPILLLGSHILGVYIGGGGVLGLAWGGVLELVERCIYIS